MAQISRFSSLVARALFLRTDAYEEVREARNPFLDGLLILIIIGVVIALASLVGAVLEWASTPNVESILETVYEGLIEMPWYQDMLDLEPDFAKEFAQWFEIPKTFVKFASGSSLGSAAGNLILTPLGLIIRWLIYGLLAHFFARLLKGEANLSQTLGATAIAIAPEILKIAEVVPMATVGGVVGTWTLICRYIALKQVHRLGWSRALWATILPNVVLWLLGFIVAIVVSVIFGALVPQLMGGLK